MINNWLRAIGFYRGFLIVSFIPASTGLLMALMDGHDFLLLNFALAIAGIWAFHVGTNLINDYYDYLYGTDVVNQVQTPFSGGTRVIIENVLNPESVKRAAIGSFILGFIPLCILAYISGPIILLLAFIGWFSGYYYSAPPFKFAYRGLGELFIGLNFGPFIFITAYLSQGGILSWGSIFISVILGLFTAAIITVNEFPDYEADRKTAKRNLVVRLGLERGLVLYRALTYGAFLMILAGRIIAVVPVGALFSLILMPRVAGIARSLSKSPQDVGTMTAASGGTIQTYVIVWLFLSVSIIHKIWVGAG